MGWLKLATALAFGASAAAVAATPQGAAGDPVSAPVGAPPVSTEPLATELITLDIERHDRLTVAVTIGDAGPYRFLVDTGAQATVLSHDVADALGLVERQSAMLIGVASSVVTQTVALDGLGLGSRQTSVAQVPLVDRRNIGGADGVLGVDALQGQRVLFDFAGRRMEVVAAEEPARRGGYDIVVKARARLGRLIIADARIDGIRTAVIIDTGAQASIGNPALARRLRLRKEGIAELFDINGASMQAEIHFVNELKIDRMQLNEVPIVFTPSPAFEALGLDERPAMILGMRELRLFRRVAIDFGRRRIFFDVPSTARGMRRWPS